MRESTKDWWRAHYSPKTAMGFIRCLILAGILILVLCGVIPSFRQLVVVAVKGIAAITVAGYEGFDEWAIVPLAQWDFYHTAEVLATLAVLRSLWRATHRFAAR